MLSLLHIHIWKTSSVAFPIICIGVTTLNFRSEQDIEDRSVILGRYIVEHKATVRAAAKQFGISKSTVHKDITEKLPAAAPQLFNEVKKILETNKLERHIRGGLATKHKYEDLRHFHSQQHNKTNNID